MTEDDVRRIEATLRDAPWDLPVRETFVAKVLQPRARRQWRMAPVWAAAAVVLVVAGTLVGRSGLVGSGPASESTSTAQSVAPPRTSRSVLPGASGVTVGGFTFTPPPGFTPYGKASSSNRARFGPKGLLNDGQALGPQDMRVILYGWGFTSSDGGRLWVTQIVPQPTAQHPGPRPAADPTDVGVAADTIVDIQSSLGVDKGAISSVTGLQVGPARLVRFNDRNGILLARPSGSPAQVLLLEAGNAPLDLLVDLARSAHR